MLNFKLLEFKGINCTNQQAKSLLSNFTEENLHRTRSHGSWFEINKITYFIDTQYLGGDRECVTVHNIGKSIDRETRLKYNFSKRDFYK